MIWNVMNDYATCANYNIAADSYAWQYTAVSAKPHVIADLDGAGIFKHLIAQTAINRMMGSIKTTAWPNEYVVAKCYFSRINKNAVVICVEIVTGFDVAAKSAKNIWFYIWLYSKLSE